MLEPKPKEEPGDGGAREAPKPTEKPAEQPEKKQ
jgi:hypothetical protein